MRILLEAQQTHAPFARQHLRLCQFGLRAVRAHVFAEDRFHPFGMPGAHRVAARLRRAETLQMQIVDALLVQTRASWRLEKPGLRDCGTARTSISSPTRASRSVASTLSMVQPS